MPNTLSLESIASFINHIVRTHDANRLHYIDDSRIFDEPLLGVADGDDPLFLSYKQIIGDFHLTPREVLAASGIAASPGDIKDVRVLCWVLPISRATRASNAAMTRGPSERWAHTYYYGEVFNDELRREVQRYLEAQGAVAVAPGLSPSFAEVDGADGTPCSTWSERHALFAAGLGTFGLCDALLTAEGKAMRCGSVVTSASLPVTPRDYDSHVGHCPYLLDGSCGACIRRCPAGAIGPHGHDKLRCKQYQDETLQPLRERYGVEITGCGLCQTGVPCEARLPRRSTD